MSIPIIESIAANLLSTINGITTAAAYNQTITAKRPRTVDYQTAGWNDLDAIIVQTNSDDSESPYNTITRNQHFDIVVFALNADRSEAVIDTRLNIIFADVAKALMIDHTRGGKAVDTQIHGADFFSDDSGSITGVRIDVSVNYRTMLTDPYTQA